MQIEKYPKSFRDLTGVAFGRLKVIGRFGSDARCESTWACICSCGVEKVLRRSMLEMGKVKSCGCLYSDRCHGQVQTPEYRVWSQMWSRCTNEKNKNYGLYKSRRPPDSWLDFKIFLRDVGVRPSPKHSLDRERNDEPYGPSNCRWATLEEQANNTSKNIYVLVDGRRMGLMKACRETGLPYSRTYYRMTHGQSPETASSGLLTTYQGD